MDKFDLAVIGAGPAGYSAAGEAKRLGLNVALIERDSIGGTCLNYGCIPTKALIQSTKVFSVVRDAKIFGIETADPKIIFSQIQQRKTQIVDRLQKGMQFLLKDVAIFKGEAQFVSRNELRVGNKHIKAKNIIIATGSRAIELPNLKFDGQKIVSSRQLLDLETLPETLLIVGGGAIGCEFANIFSSLGVKVTIVELLSQLLPAEDQEAAAKLTTAFKKQGIAVCTETDAQSVNLDDFDLVLLSVGRMPDFGNLDLERIGVKTEGARLVVDAHLETTAAGVYAAGDCAGTKLLAHYATHQGQIAVSNIVNGSKQKKIESELIPNCIFTNPEVASIGITVAEAEKRGIDCKISRFDFMASGMARILNETHGFIKIVSDKKTEQILGAVIIGPKATELIGIFTVAVQSGLKLTQLQKTVFAHPTLSESIQEAK